MQILLFISSVVKIVKKHLVQADIDVKVIKSI